MDKTDNRKKKVLLIEDDENFAENLKLKIKKAGYDLSISFFGEDAVNKIRAEESIDLVIIDLDLKGGIDCIQTIELIQDHSSIPIVFLYSSFRHEKIAKTEAFRVAGYLEKNSSSAVISAILSSAFKIKESEERCGEAMDIYDGIKEERAALARVSSENGESIFKEIISSSSDITVLIDRYGNQFYISPSVEKVTGFKPKELTGQILRVIHPDDLPPIMHTWNNVLNKKDAVDKVIYRHIHKTKGHVWFEAMVHNCLYNPLINAVVVTIRDITAHKAIEDKLQDSENLFTAYMEHLPSLVMIKDERFRPIFANRKFREFFQADKWMGKTPDELFSEDVAQLMIQKDREAIEKGYVSFEEEWEDSEGIKHFFNTQKFKITASDGKELLALIIDDITEKKKAVDMLRDSEERFSIFMENIPAALFLKDEEGRVLFANRYLKDLFGWDECEGKLTTDLLPNEMAQKMMDDDRKALLAGYLNKTEIVPDGNGGNKYFDTTKFIIDSHYSGKLLGGIASDITLLKKTENDLADLVKEKEALYGELQHRIKNSLSLINGIVSIEKNKSSDDETSAILEKIKNRVLSLSDLYTILFNSGDISAISVKEYLERIIQSIRESYLHESRMIKFETNIAEIEADGKKAAALGLILNELLTNAIKYSFPDRQEGTITVLLKKGSSVVQLSVMNDGIPLPGDFSPERSTGMGLDLVSLLAKQLEGALSYETGKLTVFTVAMADL